MGGVLLTTVSFLILLKIYLKITEGKCRNKRDMTGKTVIVTGANSGIGLETARELARRNAKVILACRSSERGREAVRDIIITTGNREVSYKILDLASQRSIREFVKDILANETRLDVLINNAAYSPPPGTHRTEDGHEVQFATNHFGPFLLTNLLLPLLRQSEPSRIIIVSSIVHYLASLDLNNLNFELYERHPFWVYCSTKLANLLFVTELNARLQGTGVTVNAVHPGAVNTSIARNLQWKWWLLFVPVIYSFLKSSVGGAQTSVHLAVSEEVEGVSGKYFVDCQPAWSSPKSRHRKLAKELWEVSEKLTGLYETPMIKKG